MGNGQTTFLGSVGGLIMALPGPSILGGSYWVERRCSGSVRDMKSEGHVLKSLTFEWGMRRPPTDTEPDGPSLAEGR